MCNFPITGRQISWFWENRQQPRPVIAKTRNIFSPKIWKRIALQTTAQWHSVHSCSFLTGIYHNRRRLECTNYPLIVPSIGPLSADMYQLRETHHDTGAGDHDKQRIWSPDRYMFTVPDKITHVIQRTREWEHAKYARPTALQREVQSRRIPLPTRDLSILPSLQWRISVTDQFNCIILPNVFSGCATNRFQVHTCMRALLQTKLLALLLNASVKPRVKFSNTCCTLMRSRCTFFSSERLP